LRARHFVDKVAVDIDEAGAVRLFVDQMVFPDFIVESAGFGHSGTLLTVGTMTLVCASFSASRGEGKDRPFCRCLQCGKLEPAKGMEKHAAKQGRDPNHTCRAVAAGSAAGCGHYP